jgi:alpha-1,2-mannosyltransferase
LEDPLDMRLRARISAKRFTEEEFAKGFVQGMEKLIHIKVTPVVIKPSII